MIYKSDSGIVGPTVSVLDNPMEAQVIEAGPALIRKEKGLRKKYKPHSMSSTAANRGGMYKNSS